MVVNVQDNMHKMGVKQWAENNGGKCMRRSRLFKNCRTIESSQSKNSTKTLKITPYPITREFRSQKFLIIPVNTAAKLPLPSAICHLPSAMLLTYRNRQGALLSLAYLCPS